MCKHLTSHSELIHFFQSHVTVTSILVLHHRESISNLIEFHQLLHLSKATLYLVHPRCSAAEHRFVQVFKFLLLTQQAMPQIILAHLDKVIAFSSIDLPIFIALLPK